MSWTILGGRTAMLRLPYPRILSTSVVVKNYVYTPGGYLQLGPTDKNGQANAAELPTLINWSVDSPSWTFLANMSDPKGQHCVVTNGDDKIWAMGHRKELEQYSISENKWTTISRAPPSFELYVHLCAYWDGYIIIRSQGTEGTFHIYDVAGNVWSRSNVPETRDYSGPMIALIPWDK